MRKIEAINKIHDLAARAIIPIEADRDHGHELTKEDEKDLKILNKIEDLCRQTSCFMQLDITEDGQLDFSVVSAEWIKRMLELTETSQTDLAEGVNVEPPQISKWLSGDRNPSGAAQAAIWYYFRSLVYT